MKSIFKGYWCTPPRVLACRHLGYGSLMIAVVTAIIVAFAALAVTHVNQAAYSGLTGNKIALQAQEYALSKAEFVRAVSYDDLTAQSRSLISNSVNFYDEVIIGAETDYPEDNSMKQRICTVNVYKDAEVLPRYSLRIRRLSASQGGAGVPAGTIWPWYGQLANMPSGFALCNGSNGTPDLRDRFIVGAGSTYALGATGGANTVTLTAANTPAHIHGIGYNNANNYGWRPATKATGTTVACTLDSQATYQRNWNGSGSTNGLTSIGTGVGAFKANELTTLPVAASNASTVSAHENRPPYYALYYIMKL